MLRTRADVAEAQLAQQLADRALVVRDAVPLRDEALQVNATPAHDAMHRPIWTSLDELSQLGLLLRGQAGRVALGPGVPQPLRPTGGAGCPWTRCPSAPQAHIR